MNEHLECLIVLQKLDRELDRLEEKKLGFFREIESLGETLRGLQQEIEETKARITESTRERKRKELEVESAREALKKVQAKRPSIKTNKEYTALLKEIESDQARISGLEDVILNQMEFLEEENVRLEEKKGHLARVEKDFQNEREMKEAEFARLEGVLNEKRKAREEIVAPMEDKLYQSYIRLCQARKGLAVVAVSDGVCQGCYMIIPLQTINEIRKNEEIILCAQCNRFLYWIP